MVVALDCGVADEADLSAEVEPSHGLSVRVTWTSLVHL